MATIPESDMEIGGDAGRETLARIEHTFGRMEAVWKPVGAEEGFEVVRRRLFLPLDDEPARDDACRAFGAMYREHGAQFPAECREARYLERLKACYPIHPEIFERLYNDWATLERFQRTRGVLRLMAAVIHDLWARNDASLLIQPGAVGLDSPSVRDELTRYLPEGWTAVLEGDVDGPNAGPFRMDAENPRFGQPVAARRVARAIFLGSGAAHVAQQQVRGVEDVRVRLAWCSRASRWPSSTTRCLSCPTGSPISTARANATGTTRGPTCGAPSPSVRSSSPATTSSGRSNDGCVTRPSATGAISAVFMRVRPRRRRARRTSGAASWSSAPAPPTPEEHRERGLDHGPRPAVRARRRPRASTRTCWRSSRRTRTA